MTSEPSTHRVTHDGAVRFHGSENECFAWLLKRVPYSVHHATRHEGWAIEPVPAELREHGEEAGLDWFDRAHEAWLAGRDWRNV